MADTLSHEAREEADVSLGEGNISSLTPCQAQADLWVYSVLHQLNCHVGL